MTHQLSWNQRGNSQKTLMISDKIICLSRKRPRVRVPSTPPTEHRKNIQLFIVRQKQNSFIDHCSLSPVVAGDLPSLSWKIRGKTFDQVRGGSMEVRVELLHFDRCLKRKKEIDKRSWFAFEHNIFNHPDFMEITGDEFKAFCHMMCVASERNCSIIRYHAAFASRQINVPLEVIQSMISKLEGKRLVTLPTTHGRHTRVTRATHRPTTREEEKRKEKRRREEKPPPKEISENEILKPWLHLITEDAFNGWLFIYKDRDWIVSELESAAMYIPDRKAGIPQKTSYFTNWLKRGKENPTLSSKNSKGTGYFTGGYDV